MDGVSDNDDFLHIFFNAGLIDATYNSKQLSLHTCNEQCMMNCFDKRLVCRVYMRYRYSDIVLDASICYN